MKKKRRTKAINSFILNISLIISVHVLLLFLHALSVILCSENSSSSSTCLQRACHQEQRAHSSFPDGRSVAVNKSSWWVLQVVILSYTSLLCLSWDFSMMTLSSSVSFIFLDSPEYHSTSQVCSVTISWWKSTGFLEYFVCLLQRRGLRKLGAMETDLYKYIHTKCTLPKLSAT